LLHKYHGTNVLAAKGEDPVSVTIYFLDGDTISMLVPLQVLSNGWTGITSNAKQKKPVESAKKYELTSETKGINGVILHRIKALKDFVCQGFQVNKGDLGGWVESESNLAQEGNCWVFGNALVSGDALVSGNALVFGNA
jgi:hypothetical protein